MFEFKAKPKAVNLLNSKRATKNPKAMAPLQKERLYVQEEEQKAKTKILSRKMDEFRAKKSTNPYDLKIESKFRVQPKLSFFLNDQKFLAEDEKKAIAVQTDVFKKKQNEPNVKNNMKKNDSGNAYIEKKTGKDEGVQVDLDELFDYDKAVKPIVGVLLTKILEQSLLEVEEEIEITNMLKVKDEYFNKKVVKEQETQDEFIHKEQMKMHRFSEKCAQSRNEAEVQRKNEVNEMAKTCVQDIVDVVAKIIDTIETEAAENTKDKDLVDFEREGLRLLGNKLDARIAQREHYNNCFELFIENDNFLNMRERIANCDGYQRYLETINNS